MRLILPLVLLMWFGLAQALETDHKQPIHIVADTLDIDDKKGISTYRGHVQMTQGSLKMQGEVITVFSKGREVERILATGSPAIYQQQPGADQQEIHGEALTIKYLVPQQKLLLMQNARLVQEGNIMTGDLIEIDVDGETVKASKKAQTNQRVRVVLQPQQSK